MLFWTQSITVSCSCARDTCCWCPGMVPVAWSGASCRTCVAAVWTGNTVTSETCACHPQERIRNDIVEWLRFLKQSIGFDGWRFDFVRGYDGKFCKIYTDSTVRGCRSCIYWGLTALCPLGCVLHIRGGWNQPERRTYCTPALTSSSISFFPDILRLLRGRRSQRWPLASTGTPASTQTGCSTTTR